MPAQQLDVVARDAQLLEQKLSHIKVKASSRSGDRSLLVTEKTGASKHDPISLVEYLARADLAEVEQIRKIAKDVIRQTEMLGDAHFDLVTLSAMLWPHDEERLIQGQRRHPARSTTALDGLRADAIGTFKHLRSHSAPCHLEIRECLHGDLNVTNIAVDGGTETRGYIFDASGIRSGLAMWDLATLEVTALLHLPPNTAESIVLSCGEALYGSDFVPQEATTPESQRAMNTIALIRAVRCYADRANRRASYALCVFDIALVQVGGLAWPSGNKVCSFADAVLLADLAAGWLSRIAPDLLSGNGGPIDIDS